MNKTILMCVILLGSLTFNIVKASVTVEIKKKQYVFAHEPQLTEVLAPISDKDNWYWPSAVLYQVKAAQLEKERQLLLNNLEILIKRHEKEDPQIAQPLKQLQVSITHWRLARRLPIEIDFDLARIVAAENPKLPHGKYILELAPRKNSVQLFGAVNSTNDVPHLVHADASKYLTGQIRTDLADNSYVIIIQADARVITTPVAYWNRIHQEVMPGSQIFVPFKTSLFHPELASINQQITTLALNRVQQ